MWVLKKGEKTRNTFSDEIKDKLVAEGWEIVLNTLKGASGKAKSGTKGVNTNG